MSTFLSGLWAASLSASVMILVTALLRAIFQSRTPRRLFCLLWDLALARLFLLTALPSPVSAWRYLSPASSQASALQAMPPQAVAAVSDTVAAHTAATMDAMRAPSAALLRKDTLLFALWLAVSLALAVWFVAGHLRWRRRYAASLPCTDAFVRSWLERHSLRRRVQVRTSDRVGAPLTCGVLRPVILLPSAMDLQDTASLSCILEHEFQHIRRFDTLRKALLAAAVCLHWWNPLVWAMYVLYNRDMELACDEAVTTCGADRAGYARTLLRMEEQRGQWSLSGSHFSQTALEERIRAIMKHKKTSAAALIAVLLLMGIATTAFATAAPKSGADQTPAQDTPKSDYVITATDVMLLGEDGENGEAQYSVDGGKTWLSKQEYEAAYGSGWQVAWWIAEEYAAWLEEEKQALQELIGERGYTGSDGWFTWDQQRVDEAIARYEGILQDIKNGALYSKTVTDKDGNLLQDVSLASDMPDEAVFFSYDETDTPAFAGVDVEALMEKLKDFGISGSEDEGLRYKGQRVRCLVDGVRAADYGYAIAYCYTDPEGTVDVHTLRAVICNADGSYDPMGRLTGVAATGEQGFDQELIDSAAASGLFEQSTEVETASYDEAARELERYKPFGLSYTVTQTRGEPSLRMDWNGKPVHSLYDTETGMWFSNNLNGTELPAGALELETVYRAGKLCGLQEVLAQEELAQGSYAEGTCEDGTSFEEIFARYQSYGLRYTPKEGGLGKLSWNGQTVRSFADVKPDGGTFSFQDPDAQSGLRLYTAYDESGELTGLRAE